jgi:Ulp1 family protease
LVISVSVSETKKIKMSEFEAIQTQSLSTDSLILQILQDIPAPEPEPEPGSVEFSIMTSEDEDGLALKKRKMDETDDSDSKDSEHQKQLLLERSEEAEAEMEFEDAKLRIVSLMTQKTLSIRELALLPTGHPVSFTIRHPSLELLQICYGFSDLN